MQRSITAIKYVYGTSIRQDDSVRVFNIAMQQLQHTAC